MRRALLLLIALGACSSDEPGAQKAGRDDLVAAPGRQRPGDSVEVGQGVAPPANVREGSFRWQGRWAASAGLCTGGAWQLADDRVVTAGETSCRVKEARRTPAGAELMLSCTAEGSSSAELWTLDAVDDAEMRVRRWTEGEERPFADVVLSRC